jgi:predicted alpha/beta hydrolase
MREARYFLVRQGDDWMIEFDDDEYGPYRSQSEAMLFAVDAAQKLGEHGDRAQVCLMGENGHFRPEWTYGEDHYPPRL